MPILLAASDWYRKAGERMIDSITASSYTSHTSRLARCRVATSQQLARPRAGVTYSPRATLRLAPQLHDAMRDRT